MALACRLSRALGRLSLQVAHRRGEGGFVVSLIVVRRLLSPRWAPLLRWIARHRRAVLPGKIDFYLSFHLQRSSRRSVRKIHRGLHAEAMRELALC